MKAKTRKIVHHGLTIVFLIIALLFSVFYFDDVFVRTLQALVDLKNSLLYYVLFIFRLEHLVDVTVVQVPEHMITMLPLTIPEFVAFCEYFCDIFVSWGTVGDFFEHVADVLRPIAKMLLYLLLPSLCLFGGFAIHYSRIDGKKKKRKKRKAGKKVRAKQRQVKKQEKAVERKNDIKPVDLPDSKQLRWWKAKVEGKLIAKVRRAIVGYARFFNQHKWYKWPMIIIWAYNLNGLTIAIEVLAWIFYVAMSIEYHTILVMIAKLAIDLTVVGAFLPWWVWCIIGYKVFDYIRRSIGDKLLLRYIEKDEEFLINHPGALFVVGKQRSKKTTILTTLKLILERQFRKKAQEKFAQRNKQFPFFRWSSIEKTVKHCRDNDRFKTLEDMTLFALYVKRAFEEKNEALRKYRRHRLREYYGYDLDELIAYSKQYSMMYDNGTIVIPIWEAIERYAQLFFIYSQTTPLDISNFSIREDFTFKDHGYFPIFDGNPFRDSKESRKYTQYSHIMNWDIFRVGKVFDEKTRYDEAVEYGIGVEQELAKDRKNRYTKQGKANDIEANQDNDLFELDTKMRGHVATIDFFDFWRWLWDDQRPGSLGADNKDLTTICRIKETSDARIILPGFALEELLYGPINKMHDDLKYYIRNRKKQETLLVHLLDAIFNPLFKHFDNVRARYGVHVATLKTEDGGDGEILGDAEKLYIPVAFTYNDRFATDNWRIFYRQKHRKAKRTLHKIKQYHSIYPTMQQFRGQRSYGVEDMNYAYGDKFHRNK